jgi:hypothetical protein
MITDRAKSVELDSELITDWCISPFSVMDHISRRSKELERRSISVEMERRPDF